MFRHLQIAFWLAVALVSLTPGPAAANFYAADGDDLWNQLHAALLARTNAQGTVYDDLIDPPLWFRTQHLADEASCKRLTKLLNAFCADELSPAWEIPVRRAFMQRDLLGVFTWLINGHRGNDGLTGAQRGLARALARAIRQVALDEAAIRKLPSNLTVEPGAASQFDAAKPDRPFLPKDLLAENGAWIAVEPQGDDWMPATVHFKSFRARSAFEVRFFHPGGRGAGEAYLKELADFRKPLVYEKPAQRQPFGDEEGPWLNPATPQFPATSAWALVRRAILADREGRPVLSPIVESAQIRVCRRIDGKMPDNPDAQAFSEWNLTRDFLRAGPGLRPTDPVIGFYTHHFMSKQFDPFEEGWKLPEAGTPQAKLNCGTCHNSSGVQSVLSRSRMFEAGGVVRPPPFLPVSPERIAQIAEIEAKEMHLWQVLPWLQSVD